MECPLTLSPAFPETAPAYANLPLLRTQTGPADSDQREAMHENNIRTYDLNETETVTLCLRPFLP